MKKAILKSLSVIALSVICFGFTLPNNEITLDKITICHMPPGNIDNCHEITISWSAFQTHIDHHDDALVCHNQNEQEQYHLISIKTGMHVVTTFE
ncbi:MAG: hypothetical protein ACXVC6_04140 [Bacteroidia bacterium]